eukprot:CAMPEP_0178924180 /NCGR_PEP_ID=MMETSP0786-20121207/17173_1 /TAXON_ID=186022 /ORGANISM="Thalassionema frauenfeldii, Strain CCMP 1798" /LENGTH=1318 /DNA_ID=CAMNT_0020598841 /DNA_START=133 /DNA_END=4089 /DNA_ORIENTATION=+
MSSSSTSNNNNNNKNNNKFHFCIDRGGTFTDVHCILPSGEHVVRKLLSEDPTHYPDAPTEGIRRILHEFNHAAAATATTTTTTVPPAAQEEEDAAAPVQDNDVLSTEYIGSIRMGTTVATNALLERDGSPMALLITKGFGQLLDIGTQARPNIFDLACRKPSLLYRRVVEINERVTLNEYYEDNNDNDNHDDVDTVLLAQGLTEETVRIVKRPDPEEIRAALQQLRDDGIESLAVCLMHSYTFADHELLIGKIASEIGFPGQVSLSHQIMPMVKLVSRAHTACASAYLTPKITAYLDGFLKGFDDGLITGRVPLTFIQSDGGLSPYHSFGGHLAILSGPAGGVVGYSKTTPPGSPVIGFDMGGTSTDVSRYDGSSYELVLETTIDGVSIQAPQLDIHTVAAGGGSRLFWKHGLLRVGPESARAHPGPVCYRKPGGVLAVTDANLVLGRLLPQEFPNIFGPNEDEPLDVEASRAAFVQLLQETGTDLTLEELASGYLQVANEAMCRPIRNLTQMKGHDIQQHTLACFGGAGPQHACAMAQALGIPKVFVHRYGGVLSAYGLSMADAVSDVQEPTGGHEYNPETGDTDYTEPLERLQQQAMATLRKQGFANDEIVITKYLNLRYKGTDNAIMTTTTTTTTSSEDNNKKPYHVVFEEQYQREFGFTLQRPLLVDDVRIRAIVPGKSAPKADASSSSLAKVVAPEEEAPKPSYHHQAYFGNSWQSVPVYHLEKLEPGHVLQGPAILVQSISTIVLEEHCSALITADGDLDISVGSATTTISTEEGTDDTKAPQSNTVVVDPIQLSIFSHRFMGIAEQMGRTLQRTAISVNMKERLDFSCALFTAQGGLVANAPHIPVHLGAMQEAVKFQVKYWNEQGEGIAEGDVLVSNHPQLAGGSHLPDITVVTPVFDEHASGNIIFFVASRGHHADIGGIAPGSMPPHSKLLTEEGATIVAFKLVKRGQFDTEGISEILKDSRNLPDNLSDLRAQVAANHAGIGLLQQLVSEYTLPVVQSYMSFIQDNAAQAVRALLQDFRLKHGSDVVVAEDAMDDGSPIRLKITFTKEGTAVFDFTGTGPQVLANHNAPPAVTYSAVIYALRCLVQEDIPLNQGCLAPIDFVVPPKSLLNPTPDAAVVGGNVLTSQRIVDVVLKAFDACAASQGCMNNLTFGNDSFGYYETIAGGSGAGPTWEGVSGVHTHCTNTRITDPEILERRYPILLHQFSLRPGSGGAGFHNGGDGVIRELEPLTTMTMSILSERRVLSPYGLKGGQPGRTGRNILIRTNGDEINIGGRCTTQLQPGERLRIESPGGGGYGTAAVANAKNEE